jgi:LacI family transcriptional regulator
MRTARPTVECVSPSWTTQESSKVFVSEGGAGDLMKTRKGKADGKKHATVTLKTVAEHVGLTSGTVSGVLNDSPAARSLPQETKDRILAAARELNYRPNFFARSLRVKRTHTIGVITLELGDPYGAMVISGIELYLRQRGFFFLAVAHRNDPMLLETYSHILMERGVEGFITIDTSASHPPSIPTVAVAGHRQVKGVTNLVIDHRRAAEMTLRHLSELGHKKIVFMKGPTSSSDSEDRWKAILEVCDELGVVARPELMVELEGSEATADLGYVLVKDFLSRNRKPFTALFAYNDSSAIGAIRAIHEAGLNVPDDVSVVGFDDIQAAIYNNPPLTTVRQPLQRMGEIAAETLLNRIENRETDNSDIAIEPEFIVRGSTARVRKSSKPSAP